MNTLIEAYHAIYDVKDANLHDDNIRSKAYETLSWLEMLMEDLGIEVPRRYDGEGR